MEATTTLQRSYRGQLTEPFFLGAIAMLFLTSNLLVHNWLLLTPSQPASAPASIQEFSTPSTPALTLLQLLSLRLSNSPVIPPAPQAASTESLPPRAQHARELLGEYYALSPVAHTDDRADVSQYVGDLVKRNLPKRWARHAPKVTRALLDSSKEHGLDPLFLVALIQTESGFRPDVRGPFGEIGLMQLREQTAREIAGRINLPWNGTSTLRDPAKNVRIGAAYIAQLRDRFDEKPLLYIAAYNMGAANVRSALSRNVWPKDYSSRIMKKYFKLYAKLPRSLASVANR